MSRHYSSSNIISWLRKKLKVNKPYALPWGGWAIWEAEFKASRPFAHFFTETLPDWCEYPAKWSIDPIYSVSYYLRNRFITQTHVMHTGLGKGKWHEFESRALHGLFNELVDFIEIEQAWHHLAWNSGDRKKYAVPWWRTQWYTRWGEWRCAESGIDYLKWCMTLDDPDMPANDRNPGQATSARETLALYMWWKEVYLKRPEDSYDAVGYTAFNAEMSEKYGEDEWLSIGTRTSLLTADEVKRREELRDLAHLQEEAWNKEEEEMMIRLVKHRQHLWT